MRSTEAQEKKCERCPKIAVPGERYCESCREAIRREMKESGYLQSCPRRVVLRDNWGRKPLDSSVYVGDTTRWTDNDD